MLYILGCIHFAECIEGFKSKCSEVFKIFSISKHSPVVLDLVTLEIVLELSHSWIILFVVSRIGQRKSLCCRPFTLFVVELFESLVIRLWILVDIKFTWCVFIHTGRGKRIPTGYSIGFRSTRDAVLVTTFANDNIFKIAELHRLLSHINNCFI